MEWGPQAWQYGRIEARVQLPQAAGVWPAFWMLGEDLRTQGWPAAGEIDILEFIGRAPGRLYATMHGPGDSGARGIGGKAEAMRWYFDDQQYFRITRAQVPEPWIFGHRFFILLNVAVGGNWPGSPNAATVLPQFLKVDCVRVYQRP